MTTKYTLEMFPRKQKFRLQHPLLPTGPLRFNWVSGESILDTLLDAGQDSPFSCKSGICMSCMAIVEEGCVVQDEAAALSDEDIAERKALMCQSRPASKKVRIHFTD
jgi:ring-1,2-phenylacetyl-CoA epoxidase subunit PaaE